MKVGELLEELKNHDPDKLVVIKDHSYKGEGRSRCYELHIILKQISTGDIILSYK